MLKELVRGADNKFIKLLECRELIVQFQGIEQTVQGNVSKNKWGNIQIYIHNQGKLIVF